ncbi:MAG: glutamate 5-kinase [Micavibrio sp.]|nr:glutamate 5-kinase [Micavibrio sp.]
MDAINNANLIVLKVGTALIAENDGHGVKEDWLNAMASDIAALQSIGKKVVVVSSGGIALGRPALGITPETRPRDIPLEVKQAASAVGQYHVFNGWHSALAKHEINTAQVLLTMSETENRRMHLNARATLLTLLKRGIVPVINENDTISTEEIRFGDNDRLAVRVAQMIGADTVVLLSTIDGLYTDNPHKNPDAKHIALVETITDEHIAMAGDAVAGLSTGGMKSKISAAIAAVRAGISLIITDGQAEHVLRDISQNNATLFAAKGSGDSARKKWIGAHMSPKGSVTVDAGALSALQSGKSLLPVGINVVSGKFKRGDAVEIKAPDGKVLGLGLSAYDAENAALIIGKRSKEIANILGYAGRIELIHRNDMALEI